MGKKNRIRVVPASYMREMTEGEIKTYGLEMCMNGSVEERLKCLDKVLSWSDQEIMNYLMEILGNPERTFYRRYPDYYNAVFRKAVKENKEFVSQIGQ
jgi:hypothetical protein